MVPTTFDTIHRRAPTNHDAMQSVLSNQCCQIQSIVSICSLGTHVPRRVSWEPVESSDLPIKAILQRLVLSAHSVVNASFFPESLRGITSQCNIYHSYREVLFLLSHAKCTAPGRLFVTAITSQPRGRPTGADPSVENGLPRQAYTKPFTVSGDVRLI